MSATLSIWDAYNVLDLKVNLKPEICLDILSRIPNSLFGSINRQKYDIIKIKE